MKPIRKYINDYLDYLEIEKGLSNKTQENYQRFLEKFFNWLDQNKLDKITPKTITEKHVWQYRVFLSRHVDPKKKQPLKKSTQNYYLIALRSLLEFFSEKDIKSINPGKIKLARNKKDKEIKFLKLEQLKKLLNAPNIENLAGLRDKVILETLFSTGLRVAELASLNIDQFKMNEKTKSLEIAVVGKGEKIRTVFFSQRVIKYLRQYLKKRIDMDKALFINFSKGQRKDDVSRRLTTRGIELIVKKYAVIAGLPLLATPHTLRHSFATDLLNQGVDLRMVQEFLGHQNIATTQIYTHVTNKRLRDIHEKFHGGKNLES